MYRRRGNSPAEILHMVGKSAGRIAEKGKIHFLVYSEMKNLSPDSAGKTEKGAVRLLFISGITAPGFSNRLTMFLSDIYYGEY